MTNLQNRINDIAEKIERTFNFAACIPVLGAYSSIARIVSGFAQIFFGSIVQISGSSGLLIMTLSDSGDRAEKQWIKMIAFGSEHIGQGLLNIIRGVGELLVSVGTLNLGNIILLIPNTMIDDPFAPCLPYGKIFKGVKREFAC